MEVAIENKFLGGIMYKALFFMCIFGLNSAMAASLNFLFYCEDSQGQGYDLFLGADNKLQAREYNSPSHLEGTYEYSGKSLKLTVPALNFQEEALVGEIEKDFIITFATPSLKCHIVGHDKGPRVEAYTRCPTIKYIPSISYEDNAFVFYPNHMVKRRRWKELLGAGSDTLYLESFGIYYIEGDKVFMAFGRRDEERFLSGKIHSDASYSIDQLEPEKGPCKETNQ